jgi:hypothetical protein
MPGKKLQELPLQSDDLSSYALRLRERGFLCVPLRKAGKHLDLCQMGYEPLHLRSRRKNLKELAFSGIAFHLSQCPPDAAAVRRWFTRAESNIGILGGYADLIILDFDQGHYFQKWKRRHATMITTTPVAKTPKGFHVYLRYREPTISSSLHFGLHRIGHVKALGGYVVADPSRLQDGTNYRWLPGQSLFDLEPRTIDSLDSLDLSPVSPLKHYYDVFLKRGYFEDA